MKKVSQNSQENTRSLRNFQEHLLYRTPLVDRFWLFSAILLKSGTANSVWKSSDEYSLSRNTKNRSGTSFLSRQRKLSVYCLLPEAANRVKVFCK